MNEKELFDYIKALPTADASMIRQAEARQAALAKPPGSLGKLEAISVRMAGITGQLTGIPKKPAVIIMSADNGVVAEGVSSAPQSVTMAQTINFTRKLTGVGALAKTFDTDLLVTDVGINGKVPEELSSEKITDIFHGRILDRKIACGTDNLACGPAMTRQQALEAVSTGIEVAEAAADAGYDLFGIGEMGIGNTTTSTAVLSAITGLEPEAITGRGGGITDSSFIKKKQIINDALKRNWPEGGACEDIIDTLARVGGFDIAAMAGAFIGAASRHLPAVIDGYISVVAALTAASLAPVSKNTMFASHRSEEPGYDAAIKVLGLDPMLDLDMRLGEGSGCVLAFQVIKGACGVMTGMATFDEAKINDDYLEEIRKGDCF